MPRPTPRMEAPPLHAANKPLLFPIHVLSTNERGAVNLPSYIRSVVYEIGCSDRDTMDEQALDYLPHSFLFSFEPLLEKYAALLARGNRRYHGSLADQAVPLSHHHKRGVVLPLAVAPAVDAGGLSTITVGKVAGCSSMVAINRHANWGSGCQDQIERRVVPALNISAALALSGDMPIKLLKIDAQGMFMCMCIHI